MSETTHHQTTSNLLDQACEWVVRLRSDHINDSDLEQFADWITHCDSHRQAFDQVADMWGDVGVASALPLDDLTTKTSKPASGSLLPSWLNWRGLTGAVAAAAVAAVAYLMVPAEITLDTYQTIKGEQRLVELADGSRIDLNTNTVLEVRLNDDERWLHLVKGEAFFSVAKDTTRPFVVNVDGATVQALGTAFNIFLADDQTATVTVTVTVTEGTVRVTEAKRRSTATILQVDDSVEYQAKRGIAKVESSNTAAATAWRQQQMVFDNTPLHEVIATLNRYSEKPISLISKDTALLGVSGVFSTKHPVETAQAVAEVLALEARVDNDKVRLYKTGDRI